MDDTRAHPEGRQGTPPGAYDKDIDARAIVRFGVILAVVIAVVLAGTWMLVVGLKARAIAQDPPPSPLAEARLRRPPPEPRLQPAPRQDLRTLRELEEARLRSYAWVDRAGGIARIPVDRAVEILLERGLPAVPARPTVGAAPDGRAGASIDREPAMPPGAASARPPTIPQGDRGDSRRPPR